MFEQNSRYFHLDDLEYTDEKGNKILYKARRFLPQPEDVHCLVNVSVERGQRLDQVSYSALGNPVFYWKLGDANLAPRLTDLEQPGTVLRIPIGNTAKK